MTEPKPIAEKQRLEEDRKGLQPWRRWGPYLSERQWGTVREDYSADGDAWDYLSARPRPQPGLPLGRGRPRRHLRRRAAALPVAWPVERPGSDPQGTAVRPDQRRGQPRRGRQGALLLPRCHADALLSEDALQVSAERVPLRRARRGKPPPRQGSARIRAARHRHLRRRPLLRCLRRIRQGRPRRHPDAGHGPSTAARTRRRLHLLPQLWFRNTWSWKAGRRQAAY